jgi:hypothetical protein
MAISKELAIRAAMEHLMNKVDANSVIATWPRDSYVTSKDAVWTVPVPDLRSSVGSSRFIVVSQKSGKVLADELFGE